MARPLPIATLVAALCGSLLLAGCGNKGDLYLPEPPAPPAQDAAPANPPADSGSNP